MLTELLSAWVVMMLARVVRRIEVALVSGTALTLKGSNRGSTCQWRSSHLRAVIEVALVSGTAITLDDSTILMKEDNEEQVCQGR